MNENTVPASEIFKIGAVKSCGDLPGFSSEAKTIHVEQNGNEIITIYIHDGRLLDLSHPNSTFFGVLYCNSDDKIEIAVNQMYVEALNTVCLSSVGLLRLFGGLGVVVQVSNCTGLPMVAPVIEKNGRKRSDDDETRYTTVIQSEDTSYYHCVEILYIPKFTAQELQVNDFMAVILALRNSGLYEHAGGSYSFLAGEILFIPKETSYQLSALEEDVTLAFIKIDN